MRQDAPAAAAVLSVKRSGREGECRTRRLPECRHDRPFRL